MHTDTRVHTHPACCAALGSSDWHTEAQPDSTLPQRLWEEPTHTLILVAGRALLLAGCWAGPGPRGAPAGSHVDRPSWSQQWPITFLSCTESQLPLLPPAGRICSWRARVMAQAPGVTSALPHDAKPGDGSPHTHWPRPHSKGRSSLEGGAASGARAPHHLSGQGGEYSSGRAHGMQNLFYDYNNATIFYIMKNSL